MSLRKTKGRRAGGKIERDKEDLDFILKAKVFYSFTQESLMHYSPFPKETCSVIGEMASQQACTILFRKCHAVVCRVEKDRDDTLMHDF